MLFTLLTCCSPLLLPEPASHPICRVTVMFISLSVSLSLSLSLSLSPCVCVCVCVCARTHVHWWLTPVILATQDQEDSGSKQAQANSSQDLISKKSSTKKGW
jgi:hypothetical protein